MKFFAQFLEVIALLVPEFLALGLIATAFLSTYCIAKACGLSGIADTDSGFGIALALAYFVTIAVNVVSHLLTPARSRITTMLRLESASATDGCESRPGKPRAQSVQRGGLFTAP